MQEGSLWPQLGPWGQTQTPAPRAPALQLGSTVLTFSEPQSFGSCSVAKSCLTLCNPMDCSTPGFPVLHYLTLSQSLLKLMSIESGMLSNHLILCRPFSSCLSLSSIGVFSHESALRQVLQPTHL